MKETAPADIKLSEQRRTVNRSDVSTSIDDDGTLHIYYKNRILADVADGDDSEAFVNDVLFGMGYIVK